MFWKISTDVGPGSYDQDLSARMNDRDATGGTSIYVLRVQINVTHHNSAPVKLCNVHTYSEYTH